MPEQASLPQFPEVDLERVPLVQLFEQMRENYARTLVKQTFFLYESYRNQNYDPIWSNADQLYNGYVAPKVWPGSTIPRSALPVPLVFDQVDSAAPAILQAVFGGAPDWFDVEAEVGASPEEMRANKAHLLYVLDHSRDEYGLGFRTEAALALQSMLLYGTGSMALEWDSEKGAPVVSWVDLRDLYFDPGAPLPSADFNRSVIRRSLRTVEEISQWRNNPNMKIPSDEVLWTLAQNRQYSVSDQTRQVQAAQLGISYTPGADDHIPNPGDRQIEVLTYQSKSRIIVVLGREWVAFNELNPYGFIPLVTAPCYINLGRFYGKSIADVQNSNQRYAEALMNNHLDEISLVMNPPRAQKSAVGMKPENRAWYPGLAMSLTNPKDDINVIQPQGVTTNVFQEIEWIFRQASLRTGINSLGMSGVPTPSNANRTLGGIQAQMQGSAARLYPLVKNFEDYLLVPMLYKLQKMIAIHQEPNKQLPGIENGEYQVVSAEALRKPVKFTIRASSEMVTREKLSQLVPFLIQHLSQGPLVSGLQSAGMSVNWNELFQMIQDATGIAKKYQLVRPMTEEEKKVKDQPPPQVVAEQQSKDKELQTRIQIMQMKSQTELQKEQMKQQPSPVDMQDEQMKLQIEQQKAEMQMMLEQMKLQIEQEKMKMEAQKKQLDLQIAQIMAQTKVREMSQKAEVASQKAAGDLQMAMVKKSLGLEKMAAGAQNDKEEQAKSRKVV